METVINYLVRLTQANLLLVLALIAGVYICLICIAVLDRKIGYMKKELDAIIKFHGIEMPEEMPAKKQKKSKKKSDVSAENEETKT
jgi:hypothetical protein